MVKKFLKIAGVKSEADFYKKYPSEAAFFKAHPEAKDLKQYKQGGQMKKLNQLTNWTDDVDNIIPKAQYGCKGKSCTKTGEGIKKVGVRDQPSDAGSGSPESYVRLSNAPTTWEELQTYNETNPKDKDFKNRLKSLQGQFPGLTQQQMLAAGADSARIRQRMGDLPRYDKPAEQTYDRAYHMFYRPLMDQSTPVTIPQILQYQSQQPGGLQGYESTVRGNYNRPKAQVGAQLDMWGNPVQQNIVQMPTNPNAGTGQMGLNNPAYGSMSMTGDTGTNDPFSTYSMTYGAPTTNPIKEGYVPGGKTPDVIKGVASEMSKKTGALGKLGGIGGIMQTAGQIAGGIQEAKAEKKKLQESKQQKAVSDLTLQASSLRPEKVKRKYVRPEDAMFQPDQLSPSYGVGTNYLAKDGVTLRAQTGMQIGGNLTEIQNMYNPGDIYSDLGFEPLNDSNQVKQYYHGGGFPHAQNGFMSQLSEYGKAGGADQASQLFGGFGSALGGSGLRQNAGSRIGGGIGKTAGSLIGGPIGGVIGGAIGGLAGGFIDQKGKKIAANQEATQQNLQTAAFNSGAQALQSQYSSFMREGGFVPYEEGGWVSHDWQPQVIATFGEHKMSDLLRPDPSMDTLRTGGHITQNNIYPQDRYALGGELKTTWGGYAESMSHNPYMPGTGETVMFRGKSHDESDGNGHTGIGVKYGAGDHDSYTDYAEYGTEQADADVEVERGEPAAEMMDPATGDKSMVVFGNLKIPNSLLEHIGDNNAKGKKFKNYVADLAKKEDKQNKIIEKASGQLSELNVYSPIDKLKMSGLQAMLTGADMKLKQYADRKMNAAAVQNAINDTAAEHGLDADALARGKQIKDKELMKQQAKYGKELFKAQNGTNQIENLQNALGMDPSTPGYGKKVGPKTLKAYKDFVYDYFKKDPNYANIPKEKFWEDQDNSYDNTIMNRFFKDGKIKLNEGEAEALGLTPEGYKKTSQNIPATSTQTRSSNSLPGVKQSDYEYLKGLYDEAKKQKKGDAVLKFQKEYHRLVPDYAKKVLSAYPPTTHGGKHKPKYTNKDLASNEDEIFGKRTERYMTALDKSPRYEMTVTAPTPEDMPVNSTQTETTPTTETIKPVEALKRSKLIDYGNMLLPYVRPTDADYNVNLYPEMTALSLNQLDPVQSQLYRPQLMTPYDVSYQDQLNEVTAQARAAERMAGQDPAAAAAIMAQANRAKSQILGEQFRQNQAQRMGVYNQNIATLNDAQLKNLGILDTQYERQAKAKSNTKQQAIEIAKSMADKVDKNRLENRTLQTYENMYNYRFGADGKAQNYNPLAQFDVALGGSGTSKSTGSLAPDLEYTYNSAGQIIGTKKSAKSKDDTARNGSIVKAIKGL